MPGGFGIVLLAAGNSSRMGVAKQLLPFQGKPLLRHAAEVALASGCRKLAIVLGARAGELRSALHGMPVTIVTNERWAEGMGTSIRAGLDALQRDNLDGVILALADQPLVTAVTLNRLFETHLESGQPIVASAYAGTVGVPVFFAKTYYPALMGLAPSQGCKGVILANSADAVHLPCPEAETDLDTPQDYERVAASLPPPANPSH